MREIRFRALDDKGNWQIGTYYYGVLYPTSFEGHYINDVMINPETLGQFTGLYDSTKWDELTEEERDQWTIDGNMPSEWKGKRVFEGDIVKYTSKHSTGSRLAGIGKGTWDSYTDFEFICKIIYDKCSYKAKIISFKKIKEDMHDRRTALNFKIGTLFNLKYDLNYVVIGNIHQNKDLLK